MDAVSRQRCLIDSSAVRRAPDLYDGVDYSVDVHLRCQTRNVSDDHIPRSRCSQDVIVSCYSANTS